ncbi:MAG: bis(5'-nucleosyl)-tetraphosphatase (symmetrical) YqeK [Spirochaetales bacterium]|nr:bis(5'-nucleosyl)-tetraphosphatase (symmetrical) YqeK [Spirochaetales bacterium]
MAEKSLSSRLDEALEAALGEKRRLHSRGVAALAAELCEREGIDPEKGRVAGLAHDLCRALPAAEQAKLASACPVREAASLSLNPRFAHGPAAATLLATEYACSDPDILEAVAFHTLPRTGSGILTRILYLADKNEPGRAYLDPVERDRVVSLPIDQAFRASVEAVVEWLRAEGRPLAPETADLYDSVRTGAS